MAEQRTARWGPKIGRFSGLGLGFMLGVNQEVEKVSYQAEAIAR